MSETTPTPWSPARDLVAPDPGGLNRALDRAASEHLREVAPHLAPSAPAPPQPEPAKADAPRRGSKAWAIQEACRIVGIAFHGIAEYDEASDCFCSESPHQDYRNGGHALAFVEQAVREKLAREKAPAPPAEASPKPLCVKCGQTETARGGDVHCQGDCDDASHGEPDGCHHFVAPPVEATGEMSEEEFSAGLERLVGHAVALGSIPGFMDGANTPRGWAKQREVVEARTPLLDAFAALRTRAREAEERAEQLGQRLATVKEALDGLDLKAAEDVWAEVTDAAMKAWDKPMPYNDSPIELVTKIIDERDEAREQREAIRKHSSAEIGRLGLEVARFRDDFAAAHGVAREADRMLGIERAARVAAEAERDRLRECHRTAAETVWEVSVARTKVEKALAAAEAEREAYRQDRDLTAHRLAAAEAENGRLQLALNDSIDRYKAQAKQIAAAEAEVASLRVEVSRLRLVYDDPSLDATDGAHPAWWRGSDAGVAGAVRIVNEALDGPLPLVGCVGGADLEAVRQRVAALRASVARLVEAGDEARDILNAILDNQYTYRERVDAVDRWVARWAAAKAGRALDATGAKP